MRPRHSAAWADLRKERSDYRQHAESLQLAGILPLLRRSTGDPLHRNLICARPLALAGIALLATGAAYAPVLDNYFYEIDDSILLDSARRGESPTPQFRPFCGAWNELLYAAFGTAPAGYYAAGLLLHALNAFLLGALVQRLCKCGVAAAVATIVFALFYSPSEAVLWISANCGLLCASFVLVAALAWLAYLDGTRWRALAYSLALGSVGAAALCKQEAVIAMPLLLGLQVVREGWGSLVTRAALARYGPFALLAAAYLPLAWNPRAWMPNGPPESFALGPQLALELFGNFALLFAIGRTAITPFDPGAVALGVLLCCGIAALALRWRSRLLAAGLLVALFGLLPALPGPFAIAGSRYAYPSAIGVALMVPALVERLFGAGGSAAAAWRCGALAAGLVWAGAEIWAVRSIESWRYAARAERFERLMSRCDERFRELRAVGSTVDRVAFLAPPVWNRRDFECAMPLFHSQFVLSAYGEDRALDAVFASAPPARLACFVAEGDELRRVRRREELSGAFAGAGAIPVVWCVLRRAEDLP